MRIGIVGSGGMASERAKAFKELGADVSGAYIRSPERASGFADALGIPAFGDYSGLLAESDAVVISVSNAAHASLAYTALDAGQHVLVEYPLCTSLAEAHRLREVAAANGLVLMVGNTIIHEAMFNYLSANLPRLGSPLSASSRVAFYSGDLAGSWYMDPEATGPRFASLHYHHIEYYKRLLGEVEWVMAVDQSTPDPDRPGYDALVGGALHMGHKGGPTSTIQWYLSSSGDGLPRGLWLNGTQSSVTIVSQEESRSLVIWDSGREGRTESIQDDWGVSANCRDFIRALTGQLDHHQRLEEDLETLRIALLATDSARTGEKIGV